jgi:hypothetical protein
MSNPVGRTLPLTAPRRLIGDLLHFARQVPSIPVQRRMNLADLRRARGRKTPKVSWCTLFTSAYARVAAAIPQLRRAYLSFPRPRLYEHPFSIASVAIERDYQGESAVLFGHLRCPEGQTLAELDGRLRRLKEAPVESNGVFRRGLRVSRLPRPLRRALWWYALNVSGPLRARHLGTFGVSVYSGLGAESLHPLSPLTTTLHYGVIRPSGTVDVRIIYDHRVLDGATVARALAQLEAVLHEEILGEIDEEAAARAEWRRRARPDQRRAAHGASLRAE